MSETPLPSEIEAERQHPLRGWLSRPAGLPWELASVAVMFVITASLLVAVFGEVSRLPSVSWIASCGGAAASSDSLEKRLEHFCGSGLERPWFGFRSSDRR